LASLIEESYGEKGDNRSIKLFFQDEGRFGRINNLARCWQPKMVRAVIGQQLVREYTYAYTAVCPETGETFSLILPYADTNSMNIFIKSFLEHFSRYRIIMVLDKAGWHRSKKLNIPDNIVFWHLPPYSPELNPVENLWDYIREQKGFNNKSFNSIKDVENQLEKALYELYCEKEKVKKITLFNWIYSAIC
jgi:transposase